MMKQGWLLHDYGVFVLQLVASGMGDFVFSIIAITDCGTTFWGTAACKKGHNT
jgi:hypothetical protein